MAGGHSALALARGHNVEGAQTFAPGGICGLGHFSGEVASSVSDGKLGGGEATGVGVTLAFDVSWRADR